jgi:hypothetical protein
LENTHAPPRGGVGISADVTSVKKYEKRKRKKGKMSEKKEREKKKKKGGKVKRNGMGCKRVLKNVK